MRLNHRPVPGRELADLFDRFGEPEVYEAAQRRHVPMLWRRWIDEGRMMAHAIEDRGDPGRPRPVGFSAVVCVSEDFAARLRRAPRPFVRADLVRRCLDGEAAVLDREGMRAAAAGAGLTVLFVNDPFTDRTLDDEALHLVHERWSEALYDLRSLRLREIFWEVGSARIQRWSVGCGLTLRRAWPEARLKGGSDPDRRLALVGLTAAEAAASPGTHGALLFAYVPPRFGFTCRQQELLKQALQGQTDTGLARSLGVSFPAVKKRWIAIYEQVGARAPGWLDGNGAAGETADVRGAEKRRHLLNYLRQHPEELHPANARGD